MSMTEQEIYLTAEYYLNERDAIGWLPISETMSHWPRKLAAFDPGVTGDDDDSGWRTWDTPSDMTFEVERPGGRRVLLTSTGEREA